MSQMTVNAAGRTQRFPKLPAEVLKIELRVIGAAGIEQVNPNLAKLVDVPNVQFLTGLMAPRIQLTVHGPNGKQELPEIYLSAGQTAEEILLELRGQISNLNPYYVAPPPGSGFRPPDNSGYEVFSKKQPDGSIVFCVTHDSEDLKQIGEEFAQARKSGDVVSRPEISRIVRHAAEHGMWDEEGATIAGCWNGLFDGAEFHYTSAAEREYEKQAKKYGFPDLGPRF